MVRFAHQNRLTRELEKKFSDKHILFHAYRRIQPAQQKRSTQPRPRSRTLQAVEAGLLADLVYPSEITGKHIRHRPGQQTLTLVSLDAKDANAVENKLETFADAYLKLTGKAVQFNLA